MASLEGAPWMGRPQYSPNGERLISGAKVWEAKTGRLIFDADIGGHPSETAAVSTDGTRAVVARSNEHSLNVVDSDARSPQRIVAMKHPEEILSVQESPQRDVLVTVAGDHRARAWDKSSGRMLGAIGDPDNPVGTVVLSPPRGKVPGGKG
jgi:WD40 repeat protein